MICIIYIYIIIRHLKIIKFVRPNEIMALVFIYIVLVAIVR